MGNSNSSNVAGPDRSSPSVNYYSRSRRYFDQRLEDAIKEKWSAMDKGSMMKLNRLLLRLPRLSEGLHRAELTFDELDSDRSGEITLDQLRAGAKRLGYDVDEQLLESAFVSTDADHNSTINVDEFIVILATLHLVRGPQDDEDVDPLTLQTFEVLTQAFLSFDSSKDGFISRDELMEALVEPNLEHIPHSPPAAAAGASTIAPLVQQRFMELDRDGNGRITFPDFLATIAHWVDDAAESEPEFANAPKSREPVAAATPATTLA